jgi:hypothetical protein
MLLTLLALIIGKRVRICVRFGLGDKILTLISQFGDDKCSQNENFHMDVIFHVWVDANLSTLGFQ